MQTDMWAGTRTGNSEMLDKFIRIIPDFPKPGILFRDITPMLANVDAFQHSIELMAQRVLKHDAEELVAIESRGFLFGAALSRYLGMPLHLVRKPGKLPGTTLSESYALEYGNDSLEVHTDTIRPGGRYAIVDDLIATGGTAGATCRLIEKCQGVVACCLFLIELGDCQGRARLGDYRIESILYYD
ncbi:MAG: adenine phosphoribosyltransferase [Pseudomonadales bacterium]|nr:adenine phosphoribosyltransferase [Pseudomonadales bacterium]